MAQYLGIQPASFFPCPLTVEYLRYRLQHLDLLEAVAEDKGGASQVLQGHFAKVYKLPAPRDPFRASA